MRTQSQKLRFHCRSGRCNLFSFAHCARVNMVVYCAKIRYSNRMDKQRRFSYTAKCKHKVILLAEKEGNRHAARKFSVPQSNVRLWRKHKDAICACKQPREKFTRYINFHCNVVLDMTPCKCGNQYWCLQEGSSTLLWNIYNYLPEYTALHPRRQYPSYHCLWEPLASYKELFFRYLQCISHTSFTLQKTGPIQNACHMNDNSHDIKIL